MEVGVPIEIDHLFICTDRPAAEAARLSALGLCEGSPNSHPGQGTANRRFFFHNAMLELLYLVDAAEADSDLTRPTGLHARLTAPTGAHVSPFGECFRPRDPARPECPFPAWDYRPGYLPPALGISVAMAPLREPMWFHLAFGVRPERVPPPQRQPLLHAAGLREITSVALVVAGREPLSAAAQCAIDAAGLSLRQGGEPLLEIGFDHRVQRQTRDLRPGLPLLLHW